MRNNIDITFYKFLEKSQWWHPRKIARYQNNQVKKLIEHAYNNVPYYKKIMLRNGIRPRDVRRVNDLLRLPLLTKEILRKNADEFLADGIPIDKLRQMQTGGTTGTPLKLYRTQEEDRIRNSFIYNVWSRGGISLNDKGLIVHARPFAEFENKGNNHGVIKYDTFLKFSCPPNPTDSDWALLYEEILRFKPLFINGYPSIISMFSRFILEKNKPTPSSIKSIFYSSENMYLWQENIIKDAFKIRPIGLYGANERVVLASGCEYSSEYHIYPEFGFVELLDEKGEVITEPDVRGEIVATSFINYAMPLIRYKTGDIATYSNHKCECGRNHILLTNIEGRTREFAIAKNGDKILFGYSIYGDLWKSGNLFKQIQFIQNKVGEIEVKVVPTNTSGKVKERIIEILYNNSQLFNYNINIVSEIERTSSGKQQIFLQNIKL
jgi:phenylacetate-CoA ligase